MNIPNWPKIRKAILDLDDYVCRICFKDTSVVKLHVHHIDYQRSNNNCSNLATLCQACHRNVHSEGYKPSDHEDWPAPWKISRPPEDEFLAKLEEKPPRKARKHKAKPAVEYWLPGYFPSPAR